MNGAVFPDIHRHQFDSFLRDATGTQVMSAILRMFTVGSGHRSRLGRAGALALGALAAVFLLRPAQADESAAAAKADAPTFAALSARMLETTESVRDYRVVMTKQQRLDGELGAEETISLRHRRADDCRYMNWTGKAHAGREMIYCPQRYEGKVQVHEGGLLGVVTLSLALDSSMLTKNSLRPINDAGLFRLRERIAERMDEAKASAATVDADFAREKIHGQAALCALREGGDASAPYPAGRREICLRDSDGMPVRLRLWHENGELMEVYTFRDWQLDVGLSDIDFDTANPDYRF